MSHEESTMDADHPRTSIEDHRRTYEAFLGLTKWSIGAIALLLIFMAIFLV